MKKGLCLAITVLFALVSLSACQQQTPEQVFLEEVSPRVGEVFSSLDFSDQLGDLQIRVVVNELYSDHMANGDVIFISDEIAGRSPADQYAIMREISTRFFLALSGGTESLASIQIGDGYRFSISHGTGASNWETTDGTQYHCNYYSLSKDGIEVFDNPDNDLMQELERELGMPYEEWLNKEKQEKQDNMTKVDSEDTDFWPAVTAAQDLVKEQLKTPTKASFPVLGSQYSVFRSGDRWTVSGYVDSQNSFGATIRATWIASFIMGDTSGSQYRVSDYSVEFVNGF